MHFRRIENGLNFHHFRFSRNFTFFLSLFSVSLHTTESIVRGLNSHDFLYRDRCKTSMNHAARRILKMKKKLTKTHCNPISANLRRKLKETIETENRNSSKSIFFFFCKSEARRGNVSGPQKASTTTKKNVFK